MRELGLALCAYPSGEVLDRVELNQWPIGPVCWYPDRSDRILFIATDRRLYRYTFSRGDRSGCRAEQAELIRWDCPMPGVGNVLLQEPCWPSDPAFGGCLFISVIDRLDLSRPDRRPQVWWIRLNPDGTAVVAAGLVFDPKEGGDRADWEEVRFPTVRMVRRHAVSGLPGSRKGPSGLRSVGDHDRWGCGERRVEGPGADRPQAEGGLPAAGTRLLSRRAVALCVGLGPEPRHVSPGVLRVSVREPGRSARLWSAFGKSG